MISLVTNRTFIPTVSIYICVLYMSNYLFQVLAKASKIIPVMVMGKIISHTTYEYYEYVTAILISIGMTLFMLDSSDHKNGNISG